MATWVHAELAKYRTARQKELDRLSSKPAPDSASLERQAQLRKLLSNPLRLSAEAIAVSSAKSPDGTRHPGLDKLEAAMVEAAL